MPLLCGLSIGVAGAARYRRGRSGCRAHAALGGGDSTTALPYMTKMRMVILLAPLFALLAGALWFAADSWIHLSRGAIPFVGWLAIAGGVFFSLLVGGGLMALMFYSNRHGYDDLDRDTDIS